MYDVIISFTGILLYKHKSQAADILDAGMHVSAACPQQHHLSSDCFWWRWAAPPCDCTGRTMPWSEAATISDVAQLQGTHPGTESKSSTMDSDTCAVDAETGGSLCHAQRRPYLIFNMLYAHILQYWVYKIDLMPNFAFHLLNSTFGVDCVFSLCLHRSLTKLNTGVRVSVKPVIDRRPVQHVLCLLSYDSWEGLG